MAIGTDDQANVISRFKEVCDVNDEMASDFLHRNDWNLEAAVQHYFQTGGQLEVEEQNMANTEQELRQRHVANGPSTSGMSLSGDALDMNNYHPAVPLQRRMPPPVSWSEWLYGLITLPIAFTYHSIVEMIRFFWFLVRSAPLAVADARGDVTSFVREFENKYGNEQHSIHWLPVPYVDNKYGNEQHSIHWLPVPYVDALNECKRALRFMIVYLHNPSHSATERFVKESLLTQQMAQFIQRNDIIMWGVSVRSQEGYKVAMALRENTYPFLGLMCMREHQMSMVLRLEGEYELEPMLYTIQTAIDENRMYLNAVREEREQREANSRIRREQEADYQRSLEADRARMDQIRRAESEKQLAEKREAEMQRQREIKKEKLQEIRRRLASELPPECSTAEHIKVSVRFPCGERFQRAFHTHDSLEALFNATLAHEKCPDDFTLICSYPRRQLNCAPEWYREYGSSVQDPAGIQTFEECGFASSLVVLVQDNNA